MIFCLPILAILILSTEILFAQSIPALEDTQAQLTASASHTAQNLVSIEVERMRPELIRTFPEKTTLFQMASPILIKNEFD
jgi:hypothetical protein